LDLGIGQDAGCQPEITPRKMPVPLIFGGGNLLIYLSPILVPVTGKLHTRIFFVPP
jgi:hypothetical protein